MIKRPWLVTLIAWLFVAVGIFGFVYHATEVEANAQFDYDLTWVLAVRLLAIVAGVFLLSGANWARWIVLLWMAYHVVLSAFHSLGELTVHVVFLLGISYILSRPDAVRYFRSMRIRTPEG